MWVYVVVSLCVYVCVRVVILVARARVCAFYYSIHIFNRIDGW
jgi:hypothetical protein